MRITSAGYIGINNNTPTESLHVSGNIINTESVGGTGDKGIMLGSGHRLGLDQTGTRSWTFKPTNGQLQLNSGDGAGSFRVARIAFGGDSADANCLDDYEEGNYVPTFGDSNGNNHTINTNYNNLAYERIGSFVSVHGRIRLSAKNNSASSTYAHLSLPFTSSTSPPEDAGRVTGSVVIQNSTANINSYATHPTNEGNSYVQIGLSNDTAFTGDPHTKFSGNELIAVQIMYRAA